ncbi:MAG: asparagine synthase (glutamine-hydrolyzing) [Patescibacteria group bacterium]
MCGILAVTGTNKDTKRADAMLQTLARRGPDDQGILSFRSCVLGQTRLSIIDIAGGHQPMRDSKHNIAITFNGEIYNYKELKKELENKGYIFSTNSDTEVILKAYQEYGVDCPKHLDGMFAFALWDDERQSLFMARDRFGKKPLYYAYDPEGNLLVASEIKALFASGRITGELDHGALDNYLALMYVPPTRTIYKNVFTLLPAECAVYKGDTLTKSKYWQLECKPLRISYTDAKEEIRRLFTDAVKKRLVADVEIGSFLSGGVDSTLVTAYAQKLTNRPLKTFSLGYGDYRNELPFAEEAVKKIGTDHYTLQANEDLLGAFKASIAYFDEPHADSSDFPQSLLSQFAATKVKVALSGDGADELFMGYGWYQKHWNLSYRKHTFEKLFLNPFEGYIKNISIFSESERKTLWGNSKNYMETFVPSSIANSKLDPIEKINLFDLTTYLPGQLLSKVDMMGMMHGLEVRSPFLDYKLAEFVYNLPMGFKMNKGENKIILKDILSEIMPQEFVYRRKQGFGAPVKEWLKTPQLENIIKEKLGSGAHIYGYLEETVVREIVSSFYGKKDEEVFYKIWAILCLELWMESHNV